MRHIVLVISCMLFTLYAFSQNDDAYTKDSLYMLNVTKLSFSLDSDDTCTLPLQLPFRTIQVEDARFDTSQIAIHSYIKNRGLLPFIENDKINTDSTTGGSITKYFNHFYRNNLSRDGDAELVCFLKRLKCERKDTMLEEESLHSAYGEIDIVAEVFLHTGNKYYAAFKMDTTLVNWLTVSKRGFALTIRDFLLMPALEAFKNKLNKTNWDLVLTKKAFDKDQVYQHYYDERFKIPILYQPYKKGLYKTAAEFVNNAPSVINATVKKRKNIITSLLDSNGNKLTDIRIFGYCDGKVCWLLKPSGCCPLIHTGNCFYYFITYGAARRFAVLDFDVKK